MKKLRMPKQVDEYCHEVAVNPGAVLSKHISDDEAMDVWRQHRPELRERLFTPLLTLWTFIAQVLNADKSLSAATVRAMTMLSQAGKRGGSHDPSGYCKARYRIPLEVLMHLVRTVAARLESLAATPLLWHGHRVLLVDGSSVSMPDTPANQQAFPQPSTQKEGCGFPVARIVGLFSLTTGALVDLAVGKLKDSELGLWKQLWANLERGAIAVADRGFANYADICELVACGAEIVFRIDKTRKVDFRRGKRLGRNDHIVEYVRPQKRLDRHTTQQWAALPASITLREVRFTLDVAGFCSTEVILATTLLDNAEYSIKELAGLYARRWEVETDFKHLKTSMQMEVLNGKKPEMIVKELWVHLLAYNLIRTLMWEAGRQRHLNPLCISLTGAIQEVLALWPYATVMPEEHLAAVYGMLLFQIGRRVIPKRPGRHEPRVLKRRHKDFKYMTRPRQAYKAEGQVMA
jgi:hypothetical protein